LFQAAFLVAATDPPDSGPIAFEACSNGLDRFTSGDRQHDPGVLDLKPRQPATVGHRLQNGSIGISNSQPAGFASTHGPPSLSVQRATFTIQLPEFVA
jgi:hypothetical protein